MNVAVNQHEIAPSGTGLLGIAYATSSDEEDEASVDDAGPPLHIIPSEGLPGADALKKAAGIARLKALPGPEELLRGVCEPTVAPPDPGSAVIANQNAGNDESSDDDSL